MLHHAASTSRQASPLRRARAQRQYDTLAILATCLKVNRILSDTLKSNSNTGTGTPYDYSSVFCCILLFQAGEDCAGGGGAARAHRYRVRVRAPLPATSLASS